MEIPAELAASWHEARDMADYWDERKRRFAGRSSTGWGRSCNAVTPDGHKVGRRQGVRGGATSVATAGVPVVKARRSVKRAPTTPTTRTDACRLNTDDDNVLVLRHRRHGEGPPWPTGEARVHYPTTGIATAGSGRMSETAIEKVTPGVSALVEVYAEDLHAHSRHIDGPQWIRNSPQPFARIRTSTRRRTTRPPRCAS